MSVMQPHKPGPLQFYRSSAAPCPYLPDRIERKLFARLTGPDAVAINSQLSRAGFRRSHDIIYKPACPGCMACVPVRVPVEQFSPSNNLLRIAKRGSQMRLTESPSIPSREQYDLFITYEASRHSDSDMAAMSFDDYCAMLQEGQADTSILELRQPDGQLLGCMLTDRMDDGVSAVYSFFSPEPALQRYSLGTLLILHLINHARLLQLPYVYLGYWVDHSQKMGYKSRFQPLEALGPEGWHPFTLKTPE